MDHDCVLGLTQVLYVSKGVVVEREDHLDGLLRRESNKDRANHRMTPSPSGPQIIQIETFRTLICPCRLTHLSI